MPHTFIGRFSKDMYFMSNLIIFIECILIFGVREHFIVVITLFITYKILNHSVSSIEIKTLTLITFYKVLCGTTTSEGILYKQQSFKSSLKSQILYRIQQTSAFRVKNTKTRHFTKTMEFDKKHPKLDTKTFIRTFEKHPKTAQNDQKTPK